MNIHEYQAKELLRSMGVPVPEGKPILSVGQIESVVKSFSSFPIVVKAQIHAGGRGKAGGVKLAKSRDEAISIAKDMMGKVLHTKQTGPDGQKVSRLYIESGSKIKKEYYISAVIDRKNQCITFISSTEGGMDIEEVAEKSPSKIVHTPINPSTGIQTFHVRKILFTLGFDAKLVKKLAPIVNGMYRAIVELDAEQVEINPLVETEDGELVVLDAKINFDNNALYRQKEIESLRDTSEENELELKASDEGLNYIKMDGNIGCMVNGAGLAMATMDIIKYYGEEPANFLDVGGTADEERVKKAFEIITSDPKVEGIVVNIFGGIVKCDLIANGILNAAKSMKLNIPVVVRLSGTNFELGKEILSKSDLDLIPADDLEEAAQAIVKAIKRS